MKTSESQKELLKSLLAAKLRFPKIEKKKNGQAGNRTFKYAPHEEILDAVEPILHEEGLILTHAPIGHELITRLDHIASGEWRECVMPVNAEHANLQSYGIELTYKRRYSAQLLLGIITEEDTDGAGGKDRKKGVNNTQPRNENGTLRGPGVPGAGRASAEAAAATISPDRLQELDSLAMDMNTMFIDGMAIKAAAGCSTVTDNEEKVYLWNQLNSKLKSYIKTNKQ